MELYCLITDTAGEMTDEQKDILYACREDIERLERLMRDLTDLSRIESGEAAPCLAPVRIEDVVQSAVETFRLRAEAKDQSLKTNIAPALPLLDADMGQIKRVFENLLSITIRYTPPSGEIRIAAAQREDYVSISVTDTGHGIPPEHLTRLFHRFLSVSGAKPGSTGLGWPYPSGWSKPTAGRSALDQKSDAARQSPSRCQSPMKAPGMAKPREPTEPSVITSNDVAEWTGRNVR